LRQVGKSRHWAYQTVSAVANDFSDPGIPPPPCKVSPLLSEPLARDENAHEAMGLAGVRLD